MPSRGHTPNEESFLAAILSNPAVGAILERAPSLDLPDWYLTAGALFQTVWNVLDGRAPQAGIKDYDLFYFDDSDLSYEAEDRVINDVATMFGDLGVDVEVRNEARVHLWYEERFGKPAQPFKNSNDAIDHFASTTCCFGVRATAIGDIEVYAPHGYQDLFDKIVRPNPVLAPQAVYESKAARWKSEWPDLQILPWPVTA